MYLCMYTVAIFTPWTASDWSTEYVCTYQLVAHLTDLRGGGLQIPENAHMRLSIPPSRHQPAARSYLRRHRRFWYGTQALISRFLYLVFACMYYLRLHLSWLPLVVHPSVICQVSKICLTSEVILKRPLNFHNPNGKKKRRRIVPTHPTQCSFQC